MWPLSKLTIKRVSNLDLLVRFHYPFNDFIMDVFLKYLNEAKLLYFNIYNFFGTN